ncbi:MAG: ribonuclease P protein component [Gammaproteobacteria bacterium]|nr:ribonuclease P protein component [Gammaproteobacteria bacterium]MDP6673734.1 ribonuclease P protein component [Gammaproteobacteria bacterium]
MERHPSELIINDLFIEGQGLPRSNRLTHAANFDHVFKHAQRSRDRFFTILYCHNDLGYPRLGLAIAKKRIRHAVARNRLKRIIRNSFRHAKNQLLGVDIVIMARDQSEPAVNRDLFASLEQHWRAVARTNRT